MKNDSKSQPSREVCNRSINQQLTYCFCRKLFFLVSSWRLFCIKLQVPAGRWQCDLLVGRETLEALAGVRRSSLPSLFCYIFSNK